MELLRVKSFLKAFNLGNIQSRQFHITHSKKALPPLIWVLIKPISKFGAIVFGRSFRKWWKSLPDLKRKIFITHLKNNSKKYIAISGTTTLASSAFYFTHVEEHPITHRRRLILFTLKQLEEIESLGVNNVAIKL